MKDFFFIFLVLGVMSSCSDDEIQPTEPSDTGSTNECIFPFPIGTGSFATNDLVLEVIESTARFDPDNRLTISLKTDNDEYLVFDIPEFQGSGLYVNSFPLSNRPFSARYYRVFNSELFAFTLDASDIQELSISEYDPIEGFVSGEFEFDLEFIESFIGISDGVFSQVPIIQLDLPPSGEAHYFFGGIYHGCMDAWAEITNAYQLVVHLPKTWPFEDEFVPSIKTYFGDQDRIPNYFHLDSWPGSDAEFPTYDSQTFYDEVHDFHIEGDLLTARTVFRSNREFEVAFRDIPIVKRPLEVNPGELIYVTATDTISFTDIDYHPYDSNTFIDTLRLNAISEGGKRIYLEEVFYFGSVNNELTFPGHLIELEFYDSIDQPEPTYTYLGFFGDYGDYSTGFADIGFEGDTVDFRGINIPIVE